LKFDLEFGGGEVTHIKWYHEDKWIRPVNGFIIPIFPEKNLKTRRNPIPATLRHVSIFRDGYR
jgi:hypothetical protein